MYSFVYILLFRELSVCFSPLSCYIFLLTKNFLSKKKMISVIQRNGRYMLSEGSKETAKFWEAAKAPFFKHARSVDYLARTILDGLDPLGERFKKLKVSGLSLAFLLLALIALWKLWIVCSTRLFCHMFFTGQRGWSSGTKQGFVWGQGAFITGANYKSSLSDACMCHCLPLGFSP